MGACDDVAPLDTANARRLNERWAAAAREMLTIQKPVGIAKITRCATGAHGLPGLAEGCPHLLASNLLTFERSLRRGVSVMSVVPAPSTFARAEHAKQYPVPESCTPYVDANSMGWHLAPILPIVLVRTSRGEPLMEARVAMKYLRENSARFAGPLEIIARHARSIFDPEAFAQLIRKNPGLATDVVQPYTAFTAKHISFRAGVWVATPPGINTVIGPPINRRGALPVVTGSIETDWHHFELFVVVEVPDFDGQVLVIEPNAPLAQMHFVARDVQQGAEVYFSADEPASDPVYADGWERLGAELTARGRGHLARREGVASVHIGCPHCYVSVTQAAEGDLPDGHYLERGFNPAYKLLKREHRALKRQDH